MSNCYKCGLGLNAHRWMRPFALSLFALYLALTGARTAGAQGIPGLGGEAQPADLPVDMLGDEALAERLSAVRKELQRAIQGAETAATEQALHLRTVVERLRAIAAVLEKSVALVEASGVAEKASESASVPAPSVFALNELYEAQQAADVGVDRVEAARTALTTAKASLDAAAKARRQARGASQVTAAGGRVAAQRLLEARELDYRLAQERADFRTLEVRAAVAKRDNDEALDLRIAAMRTALAEGTGDSRAGFAALARQEAAKRRSRDAARRQFVTADLRVEAARNRFARQEEQPPPGLLQEVEALVAQRDTIVQQIALIDAQIERISSQRELWRKWEEVLKGKASHETMAGWAASLNERVIELSEAAAQRTEQAAEVEARLRAISVRKADEGLSDNAIRTLEEQAGVARSVFELLRAEAAALSVDTRLTERLLHDIESRTHDTSALDYAARAYRVLVDVWTYEITAVDDAPITVGTIFLAAFLFAVGLWVARRGSGIVARQAEQRLHLDPGAAHAIKALSFYALLVGVTLLALQAVHFPLTAFTVAGGALAIGVGFGSQNVMNNFISGLILMLERPVRARDVVEVDGNHGMIENIGARSTQIRASDGRYIIVPNSFFLESNVVNWTLSDDLIRAKVSVGIAYGSPTRLARDLIARVVAEDKQILTEPEPVIIFEEFGDNSLNFDVYFWVRARTPMAMRQVQSGVRFRIDDEFRAHDLVIAFPQRDVHLNSASPLQVRLIGDDSRSAPKPDSDPS